MLYDSSVLRNMAPAKKKRKEKEEKEANVLPFGYVTDEPMEQMACYDISFDSTNLASLQAHNITRPYSQSCTVVLNLHLCLVA